LQNWLLILGVLLFMAVFCRKLLPVVRHAQAAALLRQVNVFENSLRNRHVAMQKISFEDYLAKRKEVTMSDPQNRDPAPRTLEARRDLVGYVMFSIYRGRRHYVDDCPPWFGVSIARTVRSFVRGRVMRNFVIACIVFFTMAGTAFGKTKGPPKKFSVDLGGGVKVEMVLIPAGEFMMGSGESVEATAAFLNKTYGMTFTADCFRFEQRQPGLAYGRVIVPSSQPFSETCQNTTGSRNLGRPTCLRRSHLPPQRKSFSARVGEQAVVDADRPAFAERFCRPGSRQALDAEIGLGLFAVHRRAEDIRGSVLAFDHRVNKRLRIGGLDQNAVRDCAGVLRQRHRRGAIAGCQRHAAQVVLSGPVSSQRLTLICPLGELPEPKITHEFC